MKLFSTIIKLSGGLMLFIAIAGFIAGCFDYVLVIKGSELPLVDGGMALALGIIGIVFFIGGHFMLKRAVKNTPESTAPQLDMNNLEFIYKALAKTRRRGYIIGLCLVLFGALMIPVAFLDQEAGTGSIIFVWVFAGICWLIGSFMIFKAAKLNNIQESEVYKTITLEPKAVTALHAQIFRSAATKFGQSINATVMVGTKKLAILTVTETDLELFRQYLLKHNPNLQYDVKEQVT